MAPRFDVTQRHVLLRWGPFCVKKKFKKNAQKFEICEKRRFFGTLGARIIEYGPATCSLGLPGGVFRPFVPLRGFGSSLRAGLVKMSSESPARLRKYDQIKKGQVG